VRFGKVSFEEWRQRGKDAHSVYADPLLVDPALGDFRLKPDAPALALGFRPIDLTQVGPRARSQPSARFVRAAGGSAP
jgi:hypothetical protein